MRLHESAVNQTEKPICFAAGEFQLEGLLWGGNPGAEAFVLCHPHPEYGGTLHNNVVAAMATSLWEWGVTTLRFNFRGVGQSQGTFGGGVEERLDVEAAIDFLEAHLKPEKIHVGGYSFGAYVGLYVGAVDDRVEGCVGVAPPLVLYDFDFIKESSIRKVLIAGADDPFCPPQRFREWVDSLREPKTLRIIPETDHFFWGREAVLKQALAAYFSLTSRTT